MTVAPISVVIPALNAELYIAEAIESVQAQTLKVSEIIVVDNGCTDRTAQIAEELGAVVVEEKKRGLSKARNAGIRVANQEWIALLDSDDLWDQRKIECQWEAIRACPDVGIVACYFLVFQDGSIIAQSPDELLGQRWANYHGRVIINDSFSYFPKIEKDFFPRFLPSCSDALLRRDVFATVGLFDEEVLYNEDFEFFLRVLARFPLAIVEKTLIRCRRHARKHSFNLKAMRDSLFSIVNHMLAHPDKYPAGAAQVYSERLKKHFLQIERASEDYVK
ncbi:MAG TPA: glycosyltransferase [Pyrinomonadaceae bacterium]|jgi:glycosyltransferase involved in cell wall biosynthesis|nr:glycosyltransferase [Pyrinomonadaceae bacterium]